MSSVFGVFSAWQAAYRWGNSRMCSCKTSATQIGMRDLWLRLGFVRLVHCVMSIWSLVWASEPLSRFFVCIFCRTTPQWTQHKARSAFLLPCLDVFFCWRLLMTEITAVWDCHNNCHKYTDNTGDVANLCLDPLLTCSTDQPWRTRMSEPFSDESLIVWITISFIKW